MLCSTRVVTILAAVSIGLLPILPAEHVHEVDDSRHGHHRHVTHRHAEPHHAGQHHAGTTFDDVDSVRVVEAVFSIPTKLVVPAPVVTPLFALTTPSPPSVVLKETPKELIHGPPPSPSLLRAPPSFLSL